MINVAMYLPFQMLVYLVEIITNGICRSFVDNILEEQSNLVKMNMSSMTKQKYREYRRNVLCIWRGTPNVPYHIKYSAPLFPHFFHVKYMKKAILDIDRRFTSLTDGEPEVHG